MKKNYLDIIDPIHDFIRVYDYELPIIDNPLFQRLRRIKQLQTKQTRIIPNLSPNSIYLVPR